MFAFQDTLGPVEIAFTDRHGGTSGGPFASLNLAEPGTTPAGVDEADPAAERAAVRRNVDLAVRAFAGVDPAAPTPPVVRMRQVHGADVRVVDRPATSRRPRDGLVTAEPGIVLMVRVADCVPVLLADAEAGVVGGGARRPAGPGRRRGAGRRRGDARRWAPSTITAWVGPHVCGACYEVPDAAAGRGQRAGARVVRRDLVGHARARHRRRGARPAAAAGCEVVDASRCTLEDDGPVLLPPPGPARPAGWPAWSGCGRDRTVSARRDELAANLERVRGRIADACAAGPDARPTR